MSNLNFSNDADDLDVEDRFLSILPLGFVLRDLDFNKNTIIL